MVGSLKEPWELYPTVWKTKSAFFTYLRGSLRRIWSRYPAKLEWKKAQMQPPPIGFKGRAKSVGQCHYCGDLFAASNLEVDHVDMAGSCNSWETAAQFLKALLDCNDNWVLACKPCHKAKSLAERKGISLEDAMFEKKATAFVKAHTKEQIVKFLKTAGYSDKDVSTVDKRKAALIAVFRASEPVE